MDFLHNQINRRKMVHGCLPDIRRSYHIRQDMGLYIYC